MATADAFFEAEVLSAARTSEHMVRLVLGGPGLTGFETSGVPDEWVRIFLPAMGAGRCYTVRHWDVRRTQLVVDVVIHRQGLVTSWAQRDCVGDRVVVSGPRGSFAIPDPADWVTLVGDLTALPAICRIAAGLPRGIRARALVEIPGPDARCEVRSPAALEVDWIPHEPSPRSVSRLEEHVRALAWPVGPGYFWMAGEAGQMRGIRKYLRHDLGVPSTGYDVMGYWRVDAERWLKRYEAADVDASRIWADGERAGKDAAEIWDDYEAALGRAGL